MTKSIGSERRAAHRTALSEAFESPMLRPLDFEPARTAPIMFLRDAVRTQSARALAMAREAGLETP